MFLVSMSLSEMVPCTSSMPAIIYFTNSQGHLWCLTVLVTCSLVHYHISSIRVEPPSYTTDLSRSFRLRFIYYSSKGNGTRVSFVISNSPRTITIALDGKQSTRCRVMGLRNGRPHNSGFDVRHFLVSSCCELLDIGRPEAVIRDVFSLYGYLLT